VAEGHAAVLAARDLRGELAGRKRALDLAEVADAFGDGPVDVVESFHG
jgi:hypothetical protein